MTGSSLYVYWNQKLIISKYPSKLVETKTLVSPNRVDGYMYMNYTSCSQDVLQIVSGLEWVGALCAVLYKCLCFKTASLKRLFSSNHVSGRRVLYFDYQTSRLAGSALIYLPPFSVSQSPIYVYNTLILADNSELLLLLVF